MVVVVWHRSIAADEKKENAVQVLRDSFDADEIVAMEQELAVTVRWLSTEASQPTVQCENRRREKKARLQVSN